MSKFSPNVGIPILGGGNSNIFLCSAPISLGKISTQFDMEHVGPWGTRKFHLLKVENLESFQVDHHRIYI